jgi:indolepyruvate ferredoxin oxidoreductase
MMHGFKLLAKMKGLRGTIFDVFGYTTERKEERALIAEYEHFMDVVSKHVGSGKMTDESYQLCVELLNIPDMIRGFGPVKEKNIKKARAQAALLLRKIDYVSGSKGDGDKTSSQNNDKKAA